MAVFSRLTVAALVMFATSAMWAAEGMSLAECREKAASGDAEAQYQLGQRYEEGDGIAKNGIRAVIQYKKAAEQKHRKACARLSDLYSRGEYVRKDTVMAAKYKAMAGGEDEKIAVARAEESVRTERMDEIEDALDWILGRNGKSKDPKIGIRILYEAAKKKPIAKMVFVKRWEQGDLDRALSVLTDTEWALIVPWFREAFASGRKKAGLIVGNNERYDKNYLAAANYYLEAGKAGLPKAWYFYGLLYWTGSSKEEWGDSGFLKSDRKARAAFEQALKLDSGYDAVRWDLGLLYLYSKEKSCTDSKKAFDIFSYFYNKDKTDKLTLWLYGLSGWFSAINNIDKDKELYKKILSNPRKKNYRGLYDNVAIKHEARLGLLLKQRNDCLNCIKQAADLGYEPAREFMKEYNSSNK